MTRDAMTRKRCKGCGKIKPLSEFYKHPQTADGHMAKCRECTKAAVQAARAARPEHYRQKALEQYLAHSTAKSHNPGGGWLTPWIEEHFEAISAERASGATWRVIAAIAAEKGCRSPNGLAPDDHRTFRKAYRRAEMNLRRKALAAGGMTLLADPRARVDVP